MHPILNEMITLWSDHFRYTREYVLAVVYDLHPKVVLKRLLLNQTQLGENMALLFGSAVGDGYTALLKEHIALAGKIVALSIQGKTQEAGVANEAWKRNATQIARFLQPLTLLPLEALEETMLMHLSTTLAEATDLIKKKPAIGSGDIAGNHVMAMAFTLAAAFEGRMKREGILV